MMLRKMVQLEKPIEIYGENSVRSLSNAELLATMIGNGTKESNALMIANKILSASLETDGLLALNHLSKNDLMQIDGIGEAKATQLLCIAEISRRIAKEKRKNGFTVTSPSSIAQYYMEDMRHWDTEKVVLVLLNTKNKIITDKVITSGTVNSCLISPREIFLTAMEYKAVSIILLHNHPSGYPIPSREDIASTKRVKDAGALLGINLIDHIIIGDNDYSSLKEKGLI